MIRIVWHVIFVSLSMKALILSAALIPAWAFAQQPFPEKPGMDKSPGDTTWTVKIVKTKAEWQQLIPRKQYEIARENGTEPAFSKGNYNDNHEKGIYYCFCCGNPLFSSAAKFDSGTGWPSFWRVYSTKSVTEHKDHSQNEERVAVNCQRCDAHLGHVFHDGPGPTGLRYCMNGFALAFKKE